MLGNQEFVDTVVKELYPKAREVEGRCLELFNKQFTPGRGPTGVCGQNEADFTICYLRSAANLLERLTQEQKG